jgi:uncharacterized protein YecE (DUF72 family)
MDVVTAETACIRLHGRNKEAWWGSDVASRYDYLYTDRELEAEDEDTGYDADAGGFTAPWLVAGFVCAGGG